MNCMSQTQSVMFGENPTRHITEYHSSYFLAWWWLHHVLGILVISKVQGVFQDKKKQNIAKHRLNPRGKPGSVCFSTDTERQIHIVKRSVQNKKIPKHASCLQKGTKVILKKMWQSNSLFVLNTKCYVQGKSNTPH